MNMFVARLCLNLLANGQIWLKSLFVLKQSARKVFRGTVLSGQSPNNKVLLNLHHKRSTSIPTFQVHRGCFCFCATSRGHIFFFCYFSARGDGLGGGWESLSMICGMMYDKQQVCVHRAFMLTPILYLLGWQNLLDLGKPSKNCQILNIWIKKMLKFSFSQAKFKGQ